MPWIWEELTAPQFAEAVQHCRRTAVLPIGCLEKHGEHLPLGTDVMSAGAIARKAVETEPAIVAPIFYFGQIHEAKHCPGTVAISTDLILQLLEELCNEYARNGLERIVLLNCHGGNCHMLQHFLRTRLEQPRPYALYLADLHHWAGPVRNNDEWKAMRDTEHDSHGGECETSHILHVRGDCVDMQAVAQPQAGEAMKRLEHLQGLADTPVNWYADYPNHYAGDARTASAEKGAFLLERYGARLAEILQAVKDDSAVRSLQDEFTSRWQH